MNVSFRLPWPPTINSYWIRSRHGIYLSERGKQFREVSVEIIKGLGMVQSLDRLAIYIGLSPPCRRKRDVDNHLKAILDAIEHAGIIGDDEQFDDLRVRRLARVAGGHADVTISPLKAQYAKSNV